MAQAIAFEALGRRWSLRYGFNALVRLEEEFDRPISRIGEVLSPVDGDLRLADLLRVFTAGLEDRSLTKAEIGELVDDLGPAAAGELVGRAFQLAFPEAAEEAHNGAQMPGKRRGTTG
jgi:hypothetical protein